MNAHQTRSLHYVLLFSGALLVLNLAGCAQMPAVRASEGQEKVSATAIPDWVMKAPHSDASYDKVVTVPINGDIQQAKALALSLASNKIRQQVSADIESRYLKKMSSDEQSYGELERKIRTEIRNRMGMLNYAQPKAVATYENKTSKEISVWAQLTKKEIATSLGDELLATDKRLKDFIHVSERGSDLTQLLSVLPALPTLEKRQRLRDALSGFLKKPVKLDSDELANLMNTYITRKFDSLMVNMQATTTDSKPFEPYLQKTLIEQGVPVSVRKPDMIIKYFLEFDDGGVEQGKQKISLVADAEMVDDKGSTFASVSKEYPAMEKSVSDARKQAMNAFTADIAKAIINATLQYIDKVNNSQVSK